MDGFHALNVECTFGWRLHAADFMQAGLVALIAFTLAWFR